MHEQFERAGIAIEMSERDIEAKGGRLGIHSEDFNESLGELQTVYKEDPTATW